MSVVTTFLMSGPPKLSLFLGGARSGKSTMAEKFVETFVDRRWFYLATAQAFDTEMQDRLYHHKSRRSPEWKTIEEPLELVPVLKDVDQVDHIILLDCLTLWLSNVLLADQNVELEVERLLQTLQKMTASVVCVSNEVGMGIVPENALARQFRDHQGRLNQQVASMADHVVFVASGLPLILK